MRALVTGGAGFIGSNLTHALVESGWTVDVVDDMSNGHVEFLEGLNVRHMLTTGLPIWEKSIEANRKRPEDMVLLVYGGFADPAVLNRVESGMYDTIFHLAANPRVSYTVEYPAQTTEINVNMTMDLVMAVARSKNKPRIVFSSTCAVYGNTTKLPTDEWTDKNPASPYALQKLTVESFLKMSSKLYGVDSVCLRYFNVYGPNQLGDSPYSTAISAWCDKISKGLPLRSDGDGNQTRDMVFVGDVVSANILASQVEKRMSGEVFNIGTGSSVSNNQILEIFRERFKQFEVVHAPERPGDVKHTLADITNSTNSLGYKPSYSLVKGLEKTFQWWKI
jgi:UDP-glucose 4-epimerase